jgi:crossover junction endodeoxyribonuclease RuvC
MLTQTERILAIDPGTKEIGVAVLENRELIFYGVKTVRDRATAQRILAQIAATTQELITRYDPRYFAIERMFVIQKSAALLSVAAEEIKSVAKSNGLPVYEYAPSTVRKFLCQNGAATKRDVASVVATRYPELARHLKTQTKWEEKYYANIFDAVAVGLMCHQQLSTKQAPVETEDKSKEIL